MNRRAQAFLGELDHELKTTRSLLAIVPEAQAEWKPHPKSMALGDLAAHVAGLVDWGLMTLSRSEVDVDPPGGERYVQTKFESTSKLLEEYDAKVDELKALLAETTDDQMSEPWSLKYQGHTKFTMPRVNTLRMFVVNHMIHHRGQLSVYLRMNDVPLPSIYGPTADNPG